MAILVPDDWIAVLNEAEEGGWMTLFIPPYNLKGVDPDVLRKKLIKHAWDIIDDMTSEEHDC